MKWITALNETLDGETLIIYPPMLIEESKISYVQPEDKDMESFKIYKNNEEIIHLRSPYINDDLYTAVKMFKYDLTESIKWMRDPNCAPPANPQIYDDKCVVALDDLREKYSEQFPELFI